MTVALKEQVLKQIRDELREKIAATEKAVEQARESFRVGDDRAENRGERGAIQEKSWLLSAQASRLEELRRQLFAVENTATGLLNSVGPGALVVLKDEALGEEEVYLVHPELGGAETEVGGQEVLAISPASPLGAALLGGTAGQEIEVRLPAAVRRLKILEVS